MKKRVFIPFLLLLSFTVHATEQASPERVDEVVQRGSHVMPFNLEKTQHIFNSTKTGGIQQVIVKEADDSEQIALIRKHLAHLAARFAKGDFSGPKSIHGNTMPGVLELSTATGRVQFVYKDLPNGGQIDFESTESEFIEAIHRYFDAQLSDHARYAVSGEHSGHQP